MRANRSFIAVALAAAVCLTAGPIQAQPGQPARPADTALAAVPTDAFLFASVKVSKLWDNPGAKPLRDWLAAQKTGPLDKLIGVAPAEIDRLTVFTATWDPGQGSAPVVLLTTRKPYNEAAVLRALGAKQEFQPWKRTLNRVFALEGQFRQLVLADDRTLIFLSRAGENGAIGPAMAAKLLVRRPDGPLAAAIALAAQHDIVAAAEMRGVEEFASLIQADRNKDAMPFVSLLKAKTATLTVDVDRTAKIAFTLAFDDDAAAKKHAPILAGGIQHLHDFRVKDRHLGATRSRCSSRGGCSPCSRARRSRPRARMWSPPPNCRSPTTWPNSSRSCPTISPPFPKRRTR
jgi:hypothetical protein